MISIGIQTRTTAFSCDGNKKDYDENLLIGRPLPWVVRVYFKSDSSMRGTLCSGMFNDNLKQRIKVKWKLLSVRCLFHMFLEIH